MTTKLLSYRFRFFDEEPKLNMNGKPTFGKAVGAVQYETHTEMRMETFDVKYDTTYYQPFSREARDGFDEDSGFSFNMWNWDGNRENPTLTPSFLLDWGDGNKLHLYVKSGKLDILPDTTIDCTKVERIYRVNVDALQKDLHSEDEE